MGKIKNIKYIFFLMSYSNYSYSNNPYFDDIKQSSKERNFSKNFSFILNKSQPEIHSDFSDSFENIPNFNISDSNLNFNQEQNLKNFHSKIQESFFKNSHNLNPIKKYLSTLEQSKIKKLNENPYFRHFISKLENFKKDKLVYLSYPYKEWFLGFIIILCASYAIYYLNSLKHDYILDSKKLAKSPMIIPIWAYFSILLIIFFGFGIILSSNIEKVTFDQMSKLLKIENIGAINLSYSDHIIYIEFEIIKDISVVKLGKYGDYSNSIHYMIKIHTENLTYDIIEMSNLIKIKECFVEIRMFLNFKTDFLEIVILDKSENLKHIDKLRIKNEKLQKKIDK